MEEIDVKVLLRKIMTRWKWFALSLMITVGVGAYFMVTLQREYLVEASIKLNDDHSDRNFPKENFLRHEALEIKNKLDDEIGILTSYELIKESLEKLDFEVHYYSFPLKYGPLGKQIVREMYPGPFTVEMDRSKWQLVGSKIHINFIGKDRYQVKMKVDKEPFGLYLPETQEVKEVYHTFEFDTTLHVSQPLVTPYLNISISNIDDFVYRSERGYFISIATVDDLTEFYKKILDNSLYAEKSTIIQLSLQGPVSNKNVKFLTSLTDTYIKNDIKRKKVRGERTITFIDQQLSMLSDTLHNVETVLKDFRSKSQVIDVTITSQNLAHQLYELEGMQAQLKVQNEYYQYIKDYLYENEDISDIISPSSAGIVDPHLNNLLLKLSELSTEKISRQISSSQNNPAIKTIDNQIKSVKIALKDNVKNLISNNNMAIKENNKRINDIKAKISMLPENEMNLNNIQRKFTFTDNIYNYLLQKKADAGLAIASNSSEIKIIESPRQIGRTPVAPKKMIILFLSVLAGVLIPLGLVLVKEVFESSVDSEEQLSKWTSLPILKSVMDLNDKQKKEAMEEDSYIAHAFRYIRLHLGYLQETDQIKSVGITSALIGEGKTFSSYHLAISFAKAGKKTLIVDADLHNPGLERLIGKINGPGLSDYLQDGKEPQIIRTKIKDLSFLSAGTPSVNPSDMLTHTKINKYLDSLKEQYDIMIIDTPPIGLVVDYLQLNKSIDYSLVVVRQDHSTKDDIKKLNQIVSQYNIRAGVIYNGATNIDSKKYKEYLKKKK
jgi:tyrosine-protein kinase Etk/Wzc